MAYALDLSSVGFAADLRVCGQRHTSTFHSHYACTIMSLIAIIAWIGGVGVSLYNGNRKLPLAVLFLGACLLFAPIGGFKTAGIALLAAIIWIANKADMS